LEKGSYDWVESKAAASRTHSRRWREVLQPIPFKLPCKLLGENLDIQFPTGMLEGTNTEAITIAHNNLDTCNAARAVSENPKGVPLAKAPSPARSGRARKGCANQFDLVRAFVRAASRDGSRSGADSTMPAKT